MDNLDDNDSCSTLQVAEERVCVFRVYKSKQIIFHVPPVYFVYIRENVTVQNSGIPVYEVHSTHF